MATGYANNTTLRRNREKIYYAVWKKAFETAVRVIADKRGKPVQCSLTSFKPGVPFVGIDPDVTPQNAASHLGLFCLHREISSKNEIKF